MFGKSPYNMVENRLEKTNKRESGMIMSILFAGIAVIYMLSACQTQRPAVVSIPSASPTLAPEPIVPTRTPNPTSIATKTATAASTATLIPSPTDTPPATPDSSDSLEPELKSDKLIGTSEMERFGVGSQYREAAIALEAGLPFSALINWNVNVNPPDDYVFWQMVRTGEAGIRHATWEYIERTIEANPGSYWIVGNEPDVRWQDNVTPQRYAEIYHEVYFFIKDRDPETKLVIGGVTQPTPLRRAYLDIVLDTYKELYGEEMPIDVWNVHAFTLREESGSWGVDIPPGMDDSLAILYEIEDHDNLEIMEQNLAEFRSWMAERGYGDKPLIVSEFGILMPEEYGFPPDRVAEFMTGSFRLFQTMSGDAGFQPDDGRLVQQWFWYSVYDEELYHTGDLVNPSVGQLTALGEVWVEYVSGSSMENDLLP